jgi:hypothetical protein
MTIILLQVAALAIFAWLLRGSNDEQRPEEALEPIEQDSQKRQ